jgi:5-methylcytosine-specific restriction endonuclease McrA
MALRDPEARKEWQRAWRLANKDHVREYDREYRLENKERHAPRKKKRDAEYYQENKERIDAQNKAWAIENAEKVKADAARRYRENIDEEKAKRRAYYQANAEKMKAGARERYQRIKDDPDEKARVLKQNAKWQAANPEKVRESKRRWKQNNKPREAELAARRRVRIRNNGIVEEIDRSIVWERDEGCCYLCGDPVNQTNWHLDHKTPVARGGSHVYDNVGVTHPKCNYAKNVMTEDEYRESLITGEMSAVCKAINGRRLQTVSK